MNENTLQYAVLMTLRDTLPQSNSNPRPWISIFHGHKVDLTVGEYGGFLVDDPAKAKYLALGCGRVEWTWKVFSRSMAEERWRKIAGMSPHNRGWMMRDSILTVDDIDTAEAFVAAEEGETIEDVRAAPVVQHQHVQEVKDEQTLSDIQRGMPRGLSARKELVAQVKELIGHGCENIRLNSKSEDLRDYLQRHEVQRAVLALMKQGAPSTMPLNSPVPALREYVSNFTEVLAVGAANEE